MTGGRNLPAETGERWDSGQAVRTEIKGMLELLELAFSLRNEHWVRLGLPH